MTLDNPFDAAATAAVGAELDSDSYSCFLTPALFTEEDDCFLMALMEKSSPLTPLFTFSSSSSSTSAPSTQSETVTSGVSKETAAAAGEPWTSIPNPKIESDTKKKKPRAVPVRTSVPRPSNAWILYRSAKIKEQHTSAWQEQHAVFKNMCNLSTLLDPSSTSLAAIASSSSTTSSTSTSTATATTSPVKAEAAPRYSLNNAAGQTLQAFVTKYIADRWRSESQEVKDHYYALSEQKKLEHARMYPDYRYTPRKPPPAPTLSLDEGGDGQLAEPLEDGEVEEKITPAKKSRASVSKSAKEAPPELSPSTASKGGTARVVKRRTRRKAIPKAAGLCIDVQAAEGRALVDREVDAKLLPSQPDYMADFSYPSFPSSSLLGSCGDAEIPIPSHGFGNSSLSRIDSSLTGNPNLNECDTLSLDVLMKDVLQSEDTSLLLLPPPPLTPFPELDPHVNDPACATPQYRSSGGKSTLNWRDKEKEKMPPSSKPSRKKSISNLRSTKQLRSRNLANPAMPSPLSKRSPKRRLKKALICKDAAKIAMSKALQEQRVQQGALDSPWGRMPLFYTQQLVQQGQRQGERRADVQQDSLLVRSYDPQNAPTEVEEALRCAESLIDSFAGIATWSSNPSTAPWCGSGGQGSIPTTPPLLLSQRQQQHQVQQPQTTESAPASLANFNSDRWQFYTQPVAELLGQSMLTTTRLNSLQTAEVQLQLDGSNMAENSTALDVSLLHARDESPAMALQDGDITFATKTSLPPLISNNGWAAKEEDWEALLRQTVAAAATQGQALDEELDLDTARAGAATTSHESMWDLVSLESHPSSIVEPSIFSSCTSSSSSSPSARFWRSETTKPKEDVLELHGTFTEEQLMSKLAQLREAKSKSSTPTTAPSDRISMRHDDTT